MDMTSNRAIKIRIYPNVKQESFFTMNFGCCRFVYNKMLEERENIYQKYKNDKQGLYDYKYKTEKQLKLEFQFLKQADSSSLQQSRRHLEKAFENFFRNVRERKARKTKRHVGHPKFKSRNSRQSYSTCITNNNIKIDWNRKLLKVPKVKQWIRFKDSRVIGADIQKVTVSRNRAGKYFASILFRDEMDSQEPKRIIREAKITAFDMSAKDFLVNECYRFSNPRFYRNALNILRKQHRVLSRRRKGSKNRVKAILQLSKTYDTIRNQKNDWAHKLTCKLSKQYEVIILEDLNIEGMKQFNSGVAKSVSLDFSWSQFIKYLSYKCKRERGHLVLVDRFFPSSKLCSHCGYKNEDLKLSERSWTCPECNTFHDRDVNASINLKKEGIRLLKENSIMIINNDDTSTVGTTGSHAFGDRVRPHSVGAVVDELGIHSLL